MDLIKIIFHYLMRSNISGLFLSLIFIRSFIAMMIFWVLSSAPCLELFSAAPEERNENQKYGWEERHGD